MPLPKLTPPSTPSISRPARKPRASRSHEYPTTIAKGEERFRRYELNGIPPSLDSAVRRQAQRDGLSVRVLTLRLWDHYVATGTVPTPVRKLKR